MKIMHVVFDFQDEQNEILHSQFFLQFVSFYRATLCCYAVVVCIYYVCVYVF